MKHFSLTLTALLAIVPAGPLQAERERICWLSDLDLSKVVHTHGFPVEKDKAFLGQSLSIGGRKFDWGFGTTPESYFELDLKPGVQRFLASVGIDDETDKRGSVEFFVYGDAELLWSSGRMVGGDAAKSIDVPLAGKKRLVLLVTDAGDGNGWDNADWADARFVLDGDKAGELVSVATAEPADILTPRPGPGPQINGARVFGVRPGNPFFFKIPATGVAPITFAAEWLPKGLKVDPKTGIITGSISKAGEYQVTLTAENAKGLAAT